MSVLTDLGEGEITQTQVIRGSKSFLVEGAGFSTWLSEQELCKYADAGEDNSVALPYNPDPQMPVLDFEEEGTIQPIHHTNADERLYPADSVSFESESNSEAGPLPGPNPDLFAKSKEAGTERERYRNKDYSQSRDRGREEHEKQDLDDFDFGEESSPRHSSYDHYYDGTGRGSGRTYRDTSDYEPDYPYQYDQEEWERSGYEEPDDGYFPPRHSSVEEIREVLQRTAFVLESDLDPRVGEYMDLIESNIQIREAAWKDVRQKALRLRREGKVHVQTVNPEAIYASVEGDHGTYDTIIIRGNVFDLGGQSVTEWSCGCDWGKWAFKRKISYVGRFCSHAYASYLELQSQANKGRKQWKRKRSAVGSEEQWYQSLYGFKLEADELRTKPNRLVPDFIFNDTEDQSYFTDVEEDDRVTTAPDQIQIEHLSSKTAEFPHPQDHDKPFQGSGPVEKDSFSSSEDYVKTHELQKRVDFDGDGITKYTDEPPQQFKESKLQRFFTSSRQQRVAGKQYSLAQQAELINERHQLGARNLDELDLEGTHYLDV